MSTKSRSRKGSNGSSSNSKTTAVASISSSIEETTKKVISTVISSIEDHVSSKQFDSTKDGLDFLEVRHFILHIGDVIIITISIIIIQTIIQTIW